LPASDADLARFLALFSGREDVHARQWADPAKGIQGYSPVPQPLSPAALRNHLLGNTTLGVYPIRLDGRVRFLALDVDITHRALEEAVSSPQHAAALRSAVHATGLELRDALRALGFDPLLEDSGHRGRHLWIFFDPPLPAERIHELGSRLLLRLSPLLPLGLSLEVFPKQPDRTRGARGLGNLIKLPLGVHRKSGRRSLLLDDTGSPDPAPLVRLHAMRRAGPDLAERALAALESAPSPAAPAPPGPPEAPAPLPAPPKPPPAWTDADFGRHPEISWILGHCPMLAALVRRARDARTLNHDEQVVLSHTLGHLPAGVNAVNYLFALCEGLPQDRRLKSRLSGSPASCARIRQRLPGLAAAVPCACEFPADSLRYPTPQRHLESRPPAASPPPDPASDEDLVRAFAVCSTRRERVGGEEEAVRRALVDRLRAHPDRAIALADGRMSLVDRGGVEELRWEPTAAPSSSPNRG
jgi:hypothetical protein